MDPTHEWPRRTLMRGACTLGAVLLLAGASCPKRADQGDCDRACARLAELLAGEREARGLDPTPGLDRERPRGRTNVQTCSEECAREATAEHVECLLAAEDLDGWIACSR